MAEVQTERQKALAKELIANTKRAKPLNKSEMLESVGYTRNTARHKTPDIINAPGVQRDVLPVVEKMIKARDRAIDLLAGKEEKANYSDITGGIDKLTKNIELLSGGVTDRTESLLTQEQLDELLSRRQIKDITDGEA